MLVIFGKYKVRNGSKVNLNSAWPSDETADLCSLKRPAFCNRSQALDFLKSRMGGLLRVQWVEVLPHRIND